ncbi:MAG TPA: WD40 repeat domain-containing protein [Segetibacter sp.]|jgi:WD40 repeat protein
MSSLRNKRIKWFLLFPLFVILIVLTYYQLLYRAPKTGNHVSKSTKVFSHHRSQVWSAKFSPDGSLIASGSVDSTAVIIDMRTDKVLKVLKHPAGLTYLCFSGDGNSLITSSYDGVVRLWDVSSGSLRKEFLGHSNTIRTVDISPDGKLIASGGEESVIKLWDVETGKCINNLKGHTLTVWDVKFSRDGSKLASGSFDNTFKIWNVNDGKLLSTVYGHSQAVVSLAFSNNGKMLATTSDDKTIKIWRVGDNKLLNELQQPEHPQAVCFSPDDELLITAGRDKPLIGEFLQEIFGDSHFDPGISMRLWDVRTGKMLQTFTAHFNDVNDVDFSPDGKTILSASSDSDVRLWQIAR